MALRLLDIGGVDVDAKSSINGYTPLRWAREHGRDDVVERLLDIGGVDVDAKSSIIGHSPLRRTNKGGKTTFSLYPKVRL